MQTDNLDDFTDRHEINRIVSDDQQHITIFYSDGSWVDITYMPNGPPLISGFVTYLEIGRE